MIKTQNPTYMNHEILCVLIGIPDTMGYDKTLYRWGNLNPKKKQQIIKGQLVGAHYDTPFFPFIIGFLRVPGCPRGGGVPGEP